MATKKQQKKQTKGKKPKQLTEKQITKRFSDLSSWKLNAKQTELSKTFEFPNFITALAFVAKVAVYAEIAQHHPDIELSYGKVKIKLTTHEVKGLTGTDFGLAAKIDEIQVR